MRGARLISLERWRHAAAGHCVRPAVHRCADCRRSGASHRASARARARAGRSARRGDDLGCRDRAAQGLVAARGLRLAALPRATVANGMDQALQTDRAGLAGSVRCSARSELPPGRDHRLRGDAHHARLSIHFACHDGCRSSHAAWADRASGPTCRTARPWGIPAPPPHAPARCPPIRGRSRAPAVEAARESASHPPRCARRARPRAMRSPC